MRGWLIGGFAVLLAAGMLLTRGGAQPNTVKEIVPGVWFREGDLFHQGHCNNVIIEMKDYLIVVNANFPSGARATLEEARKLSNKPVRYVFDTHHHGDHMYGNPVWTAQGATTLAFTGVLDELKRYEPARWQATQRQDVKELKRDAPEPPQRTFSDSPHVISDGTRRVEFWYFGWAHTRGDGFVYLPREKVLCTGDAVANGPFNALKDADIGNWPSVIRKAQKLDVRYVLPGHGGPGGKDVMAKQLEYMVTLYAAVKRAHRDGKKLDDLVRIEGSKVVSTTLVLPDSVKEYATGMFFPAQVRDAYEEIAAGKPHGDLPHE